MIISFYFFDFSTLFSKDGDFIIPTVFCTNAFGKRERKAENLSSALGIKVDPDQIILSQSPLEMFHEYHDKNVLIVGPEHDGGFFDVAQELGFEKIITLGTQYTVHQA